MRYIHTNWLIKKIKYNHTNNEDIISYIIKKYVQHDDKKLIRIFCLGLKLLVS